MGLSAAAKAFLAVTAVTSAVSIHQQREAAKDQSRANKKSEELRQRRANIASARERAKQVRRARAARAEALASSSGGAGTGGSGLVGAQANIGNQTTQNIAFLNQNQDISTGLSNLNIATSKKAAKRKGKIATAQGIGDVASAGQDIFG